MVTYREAEQHQAFLLSGGAGVIGEDKDLTVMGVVHGETRLDTEVAQRFLKDKELLMLEDDRGNFDRFPEGSAERTLTRYAERNGVLVVHNPNRRKGTDISDFSEQYGLPLEELGMHYGLTIAGDMLYQSNGDIYPELLKEALRRNTRNVDAEKTLTQIINLLNHAREQGMSLEGVLRTMCSPALLFLSPVREKHLQVPNLREAMEQHGPRTLYVTGLDHALPVYDAIEEGKEIETTTWQEFMKEEEKLLQKREEMMKLANKDSTKH